MSTRFSPASHTRLWEHLNALDDDIQALEDADPPALVIRRGKITKTSTLSLAVNAWTCVTAYAALTGADGVTADLANGRLTVANAGRYDIVAHHRWWNLGSAASRAGALVLGTSAPASDGSNTLALYSLYQQDWLHFDLTALDVPLAAGAVITSWVRSGTAGAFNTSNTTFALETSLAVCQRA